MRTEAGVLGRPGMVRMSPQIITTKPAPAARRTSRMLTTWPLGAPRSLASVVVSVPDQEEQQAISLAISDMDADIAALEQRRDKTRLLKQAMMQELLTGRTRLV